MFQDGERQYVEAAPVGRLATADIDGRPHVVPVCFAFVEERIVTPIDEKPQGVAPDRLRRSQDISENPRVALLVDHYTDDWSRLGWVQVRGTARLCQPHEQLHLAAVESLRSKYDQYSSHALADRSSVSPRGASDHGAVSTAPARCREPPAPPTAR